MRLIDIIPTPKGIKIQNERKLFGATICPSAFDVSTFIAFSEKKDIEFNIVEDGSVCICLNALLHKDEYRIEVNEKVNVFVGSESGVQYALASLYQMMTKVDDKILVPVCTVCDEPDLEYRSVMIDCARSFHTVDEIKNYIDLCWLYKLKYIHLHLADDEAFRLPMKKFNKLTSEVSYSYEDIEEMRAYAEKHGVNIVPEVDTPGHSTVMQKAYPEIFGDKGILAFTKDSLDACAVIYREICEMFPDSDYIHIGGDEGRMGWWIDWPECNEFGASLGYNRDDDVDCMTGNEFLMLRYLAHFIKSNAEVIKSCGKRAIVWEGFHKITNDIIPKDVVVMVWDSSYQTAGTLIESGFDIINCSWLPTYVVTPTWFYSKEDCFEWDVFSFGTVNPVSPYYNGMYKMPSTDKVLGGQLNSWGDTIEKSFDSKEAGHDDEFEKISERLPAIAENLWNREKRITFKDFDR